MHVSNEIFIILNDVGIQMYANMIFWGRFDLTLWPESYLLNFSFSNCTPSWKSSKINFEILCSKTFVFIIQLFNYQVLKPRGMGTIFAYNFQV